MRRWMSLVGVVAVLSLVYVASANLLTNPGFEIGGAGGGTPTGWWKYNETGQESWAARTGSTNGMAFWSWSNGAFGGFGTDVSSNMLVGQVVNFSIYGLAEAQYNSTTPETWLKIEWWTNGASTWTMQSTLDVYGTLTGNRDNWNLLSFTVTNTLSDVNMIKPIVGFGGGTNVGGSQAVKWDDASLTITDAIPEPTIAGLLGFAGLLFCAVRRRSSK